MTPPLSRSSTTAATIHVEDGEQVYPCRCGETHRGPYAAYTYGHHNCFHHASLVQIDAEMPDDFMCPLCGEMFHVGRRP